MERVKGLKKLLKELDSLGKNLDKEIDGVVYENAVELARTAQNNLKAHDAIDTGKTLQSIREEKVDYLTWAVVAGSSTYPQAGFIEFGTGPRVYVPPEMQAQAAKYRNLKTGTFQDAIENIAGWLKRNGGDPKAAYPVLMSILKKGLRPRPFLFPAFILQRRKYYESMEALLKKELGKL